VRGVCVRSKCGVQVVVRSKCGGNWTQIHTITDCYLILALALSALGSRTLPHAPTTGGIRSGNGDRLGAAEHS
jgi:hypothetical protein